MFLKFQWLVALPGEMRSMDGGGGVRMGEGAVQVATLLAHLSGMKQLPSWLIKMSRLRFAFGALTSQLGRVSMAHISVEKKTVHALENDYIISF